MKLIPKGNTSKVALIITTVFIFSGGIFFINRFMQDKEDSHTIKNNTSQTESEKFKSSPFIDIRIAAAGDIMFRDDQIESAYDQDSETYDFRSAFEDVKPILSEADMTLANFETTVAGPSLDYTGYPIFNSPDEVMDAIEYAGVDVLTTANNHSLDTGSQGLKRTVKKLQEKGFATVGTYNKQPDSRVLIKDLKGIKFAILSYTESTNHLGDNYPADELNAMINLMTKDNITRDIKDAKELDTDFIVTFMHWGEEYMEEPNDKQIEFAQFMAKNGVDLILGSHPHVIQKSELIEAGGNESFVIYSMGNFISNQRKETLGSDHELTEDGIIINFDIRKNRETNETTIQNVEYIPTWVYRDKNKKESKYTYRILPIENFLISDEISKSYQIRMERSLESTVSKMENVSF